MREWPMFRDARGKRRHRAKAAALDGRPLPRIADLVMQHLAGTPAEKLAWLRAQAAAGKLDGDDPDEIAQAEAMLTMLVRLSAARGGREQRHLDELLDEGLRATFPASDPVAVGHFTGTEPPGRPVDRVAGDATAPRTVRDAGGHAVRRHRRIRAAANR
jgi:hypothetical protein